MWLCARKTKAVENALAQKWVEFLRDDVKAFVNEINRVVEKESGKDNYWDAIMRVRRQFHNLLARCLAEKLPF
jgi:DNA-binding GntR family transcriptional regulator